MLGMTNSVYQPTYLTLCHSLQQVYNVLQIHVVIIRCIGFFFLPFQWPRPQSVTCKYLPTNKGLLMRSTVEMLFAANNTLLMRIWNRAPVWKMVDYFLELSESGLNIEIKLGDRLINQLLKSVIAKYLVLSVFRRSIIFLLLPWAIRKWFKYWNQAWWSIDKPIIELSYCKISCLVSVSQINSFPRLSASANNWSACYWQTKYFAQLHPIAFTYSSAWMNKANIMRATFDSWTVLSREAG